MLTDLLPKLAFPFWIQEATKHTSVGNRCFFPDDATISLIVSSERRLTSLIDPLDTIPGEVGSSSRPETPVSPELWASPSPLSLKPAIAFALTAEALVSYKSEDAITCNLDLYWYFVCLLGRTYKISIGWQLLQEKLDAILPNLQKPAHLTQTYYYWSVLILGRKLSFVNRHWSL